MIPRDRPFTLQSSGVTRAVLRRLELAGEVTRPCRGVYAAADLTMTTTLRREAVHLVLPDGATPVGVTAAWVHGLIPECPRLTSAHRPPVDLLEAAVTTGCILGLEVYDAALRQGLPHRELLRAVAPQDLRVAALADSRARDALESRLRWAWLTADLPTPAVGPMIGDRRVALAHPTRYFAADLGEWSVHDLAMARAAGWWVSRVDVDRIGDGAGDLVSGHLRREFHRQLLTQLSA